MGGFGGTRPQSLQLGKQWEDQCHENFLGMRLEELAGAVRGWRHQGAEFAPLMVGSGGPEDFKAGKRPERQKGGPPLFPECMRFPHFFFKSIRLRHPSDS